MLGTELRLTVLDAFLALAQATQNLCDAINHDATLPAWTQDTCPTEARNKAISVISQLHYADKQAPREILICAGFIGASSHTLEMAKLLNDSKEKFKKSILALKSGQILPSDPILVEKMHHILSRTPSTAKTLKSIGLARLHLKQCYRKIPILMDVPHKISWTWAHTRSIKKITVSKAQEMLAKKGDDAGIQIQLQKLGHLSPGESLAIVQELAPHLRANLVFKTESGLIRSMIKGPIPLLYPCTENSQLPHFNPVPAKCEKNLNRSIRKDVRIDPTPYLPAIRAHRYQSELA